MGQEGGLTGKVVASHIWHFLPLKIWAHCTLHAGHCTLHTVLDWTLCTVTFKSAHVSAKKNSK